MTLKELQKKSNELVRAWPKIRSQALDNTKEQALDVITDDQLFKKGIDGDGRKLDPYKDPGYELFKSFLNPSNVTDLKVTGDFYDGVFGDVKGDDIITDSSDIKSGKLHQQYGSEILSTTKQSASVYARNAVLPELLDLTKIFMKL